MQNMLFSYFLNISDDWIPCNLCAQGPRFLLSITIPSWPDNGDLRAQEWWWPVQSVEEGDDQFLPASSCASGGAEAALAGGAAGASAELQQKNNLVERRGVGGSCVIGKRWGEWAWLCCWGGSSVWGEVRPMWTMYMENTSFGGHLVFCKENVYFFWMENIPTKEAVN